MQHTNHLLLIAKAALVTGFIIQGSQAAQTPETPSGENTANQNATTLNQTTQAPQTNQVPEEPFDFFAGETPIIGVYMPYDPSVSARIAKPDQQ